MAELLYRTNMIALVGSGSNPHWPLNKVYIWDDSKLSVVGELSFKSIVRGLKMIKDK
jgi:WD repeat-containing protein 45